jgi:hypothetical protein
VPIYTSCYNLNYSVGIQLVGCTTTIESIKPPQGVMNNPSVSSYPEEMKGTLLYMLDDVEANIRLAEKAGRARKAFGR